MNPIACVDPSPYRGALMPETGEDELLYAWRAGDRAAGDQLMRLYYVSIRRFFQLRAADVADDLTQRTFLACTEGRERVAVTVRAYLFGIARHMLLKHVEDASRREMPFDFDVIIDIRSSRFPVSDNVDFDGQGLERGAVQLFE